MGPFCVTMENGQVAASLTVKVSILSAHSKFVKETGRNKSVFMFGTCNLLFYRKFGCQMGFQQLASSSYGCNCSFDCNGLYKFILLKQQY